MKSGKKKVWLVSGSRTPIGSFGKSLRSLTVEKLAGHVYNHALRRAGITGSHVDGVFLGHGFQSGFTPNTARCAWLDQGLPANVPAATVQRQCGSGMEAVHQAANEIRLGNAGIMLAGGAESMSTVPYIIPGDKRWSSWADFVERRLKIPRMGPLPLAFTMADNGIAPRNLLKDMKTVNMSGTAQRLADQFGITREEADKFSLESQAKAKKAIESGRFDLEIDPIQVPGLGFFSKDEHPRNTSLEKLSKLKPVLGNRDITAGNASGINDGACAVVLASDEKVEELGLTRLAEIVDTAVAGVEPETMGLGPVEAIKTLLQRNNLTLADVDLIEVNEAFAAQYLACEKLLGLDRTKVNVNGGAIALGHPIGMSGARLILTLAHELKLRGKKRGIAALCIGGGQGIATLIELP
jgi:acetyl-CoA C-acetyltransferase